MTRPRSSMHGCPGCGALVQRSQLACKPCWFQLPAWLRDAVNAAWRKRRAAPRDDSAVATHRAAVARASQWYREHPGGQP